MAPLYLEELGAGGAALLAGVVNALAGGGTLISFPALVGLGVPAVASNITNTVSLVPGYLAGSWAQRRDLESQMSRARSLAAVSGLGGLAGSILLVVIPARSFRTAVPYLVLLSCLLLLGQGWLRRRLIPPGDPAVGHPGSGGWAAMAVLVFLASAYGGFFGAGLGIMLLAVLAMFSHEPLAQVNALKQALSFLINLVAGVFFVFSGRVFWSLVPVMAVGALAGGLLGGRMVGIVPEKALRAGVVLVGVAVAVGFWVGV